jgi:hypothetical protein
MSSLSGRAQQNTCTVRQAAAAPAELVELLERE